MTVRETLDRIVAAGPDSRVDLWQRFIDVVGVRQMAEIGVFRGEFAASILARCEGIARYYMIDPWRNLENWNKPMNVSNGNFTRVLVDALELTAPWEGKRAILRGTTAEVVDRIPDDKLDLVYVDGDHTLRGVAIDLIRCYRKVRRGGWIGGDDFCPSIWQHPPSFEPTMVFPFAVYFAEAVEAPIFALPHNQFLIEKGMGKGFEFHDFTGRYGELGLCGQLKPPGDQS